jgi:hypothetical protein
MLLVTVACAKKAPPVPWESIVPKRIVDLQAIPREGRLLHRAAAGEQEKAKTDQFFAGLEVGQVRHGTAAVSVNSEQETMLGRVLLHPINRFRGVGVDDFTYKEFVSNRGYPAQAHWIIVLHSVLFLGKPPL